MATTSPEERVGQLVMVNFVGADTSTSSDIARLVRDHHVGAVHLSASNGNIVNRGDTAADVARLTNGLQRRAYEGSVRTVRGREVFVPVLIATDNEGDLYPYTNISRNLTPIPSAMTIGATWSTTHAEATGRVIGRELGLMGVNLLLGPVVDVLEQPRSGGAGDIGTRAFGGNPQWAGALGRAYVRGVREGSSGRMATVAKHFPGHGASDRLPDNEVATINRAMAELRSTALIPFARLASDEAAEGIADALMTSHIRYGGFQPVFPFTRPISFDPEGLGRAMALPEFAPWRREGLLVSDSLGVPAVKRWYDPTLQSFPHRQVARDALLAGNDLLALVEFSLEREWARHQLPAIQDTLAFMAQQYRTDTLFRSRVDDASRRVLTLKLKLYPELSLENVLVSPESASAGAGQERGAMAALAQDALSLISPSSQELNVRMPRGPQPGEKVLVAECWRDCYPFRLLTHEEIADTVLRFYGPQGTGQVRREDVSTVTFGELAGWLDRTLEPEDDKRLSDVVFKADWIVFALADYNPVAFPRSAAAKRFLSEAPIDFRNKKLVAIAFNAPYHLDTTEIAKLTAYFGVYSKTPEAIDTGIRALFRELEPRGASPVSIPPTGYDIDRVVQPDPTKAVPLNADLSKGVILTVGPILDRGGHNVPDGTETIFSAWRGRELAAEAQGKTRDGRATAVLDLAPRKRAAQARAGGSSSGSLSVRVPESEVAGEAPSAGIPVAPLTLAALGAILVVGFAAAVLRQAKRPAEAQVSLAAPEPQGLRLDPQTRRVWVEGAEIKPGLSLEQYRLLAHLYENRGSVVSRDEIINRVWPSENAAGVSEEALDALVRRVRDRLAQAGASRGYIVTVRGHGFRLKT